MHVKIVGALYMNADNTIVRQVENPCPKCGSFYRRGDECNICGTFSPAIKGSELRKLSFRTGRQWSKSLHRYLTENEIKAGKRGG
jgi:methionyl-tRNA synthetase